MPLSCHTPRSVIGRCGFGCTPLTDDCIMRGGMVCKNDCVAAGLGGAQRHQVVVECAQLGAHAENRGATAMLAVIETGVEELD